MLERGRLRTRVTKPCRRAPLAPDSHADSRADLNLSFTPWGLRAESLSKGLSHGANFLTVKLIGAGDLYSVGGCLSGEAELPRVWPLRHFRATAGLI